MNLHLVDATFELFRAYFGAPGRKNQEGREVGAALGWARSLLNLLESAEVSHVACAYDHEVESFRNELFDGYKSGEGIEPELFAQFPLAEQVSEALGVITWPMMEFEADDALAAVPQSLSDGSLGLGATRSETIRQVIIPAALPGIVGAFLLAISRAIGETMIVVMAAGLAANLTLNPLEAVTTVTVQIVTLLTGDQEFDSAKTLAAFALGLLLFVVTLALNLAALRIVRKYREQYD